MRRLIETCNRTVLAWAAQQHFHFALSFQQPITQPREIFDQWRCYDCGKDRVNLFPGASRVWLFEACPFCGKTPPWPG